MQPMNKDIPSRLQQFKETLQDPTGAETLGCTHEEVSNGLGRLTQLSKMEIRILMLILNNGEMCGMDMVEKDSGLIIESIYTLLRRLHRDGMLQPREDKDGRDGKSKYRRVYYSLSETGNKAVRIYILLGWAMSEG